jgi:hypothetical protein
MAGAAAPAIFLRVSRFDFSPSMGNPGRGLARRRASFTQASAVSFPKIEPGTMF